MEQVSEALRANPDAIDDAFFDHTFEPALCAAVRSGCHLDILRLLLRYNADVDAADMRGFNALTALCSLPRSGVEQPADGCRFLLPPGFIAPALHAHVTARMLAAARALERGGAVLSRPDSFGRVPAQVAKDLGHGALALLCSYSQEAQACVVLSRSQISGLLPHAVMVVQTYLMPKDALRRLLPREFWAIGVL